MGTYAVYRVWVGVLTKDIPPASKFCRDGRGYSFVQEALFRYEGVKIKGMPKFQGISMHGETIGFGVEIQSLDWVSRIGKSNLVDPIILVGAKEICQQVNQLFKDLNIPLTARMYHHIDLGG